MSEEPLSEFRAKYIAPEGNFYDECSLIFYENKVPVNLIVEWNHAKGLFLLHNTDNLPRQKAEQYIQSVLDFISMRIPVICQVGDYRGAFSILYSCYHSVLEFRDESYLTCSPAWKAMDKYCSDIWQKLFLSLSEKEQQLFFAEFIFDINDIFGSGVYKSLRVAPYFHFLTLPWCDNIKRKIPDEFRKYLSFFYNEKTAEIFDDMIDRFAPEPFSMKTKNRLK